MPPRPRPPPIPRPPPGHARNPFWDPEQANGQPQWVPFGHPILSAFSQDDEDDSGDFCADTHPRPVSSAGIPPGYAASSFNPNVPSNAARGPLSEYPSNPGLGVPPPSFPAQIPADPASNVGTPSNAGMPGDTDPELEYLGQRTINQPNVPGIPPPRRGRRPVPTREETIGDVQDHLSRKGMYYPRLVWSFADHDRFKQGLRDLAKRQNAVGGLVDMPQDDAALEELARDMCEAIFNLDHIESGATRNHHSKKRGTVEIDSVGVKCVKEMGPFRAEMLAWDLMCAIRDAQTGNLELPDSGRAAGFAEYDTFMGRFTDLLEVLRVNKNLVREALESEQGLRRIVADPFGERGRKVTNTYLNRKRAEMKVGAAEPGSKRARRVIEEGHFPPYALTWMKPTTTENQPQTRAGQPLAQPQRGGASLQQPAHMQQQGQQPGTAQPRQNQPQIQVGQVMAQPQQQGGGSQQPAHVQQQGQQSGQQFGTVQPREIQPKVEDGHFFYEPQQQGGSHQQLAQQLPQQPVTAQPGTAQPRQNQPQTQVGQVSEQPLQQGGTVQQLAQQQRQQPVRQPGTARPRENQAQQQGGNLQQPAQLQGQQPGQQPAAMPGPEGLSLIREAMADPRLSDEAFMDTLASVDPPLGGPSSADLIYREFGAARAEPDAQPDAEPGDEPGDDLGLEFGFADLDPSLYELREDESGGRRGWL
ncbi:hypothetical protein KVR01_000846 [Diaporthe batatas]|uniref:uncharacterized protein n=1 Tax=Diaporthe batatas TaxID=748121 RepID=UPI001D043143|nr:uncharacterized protein KVR01_000846 [Diaporthe batatas]KAG8170101.1 hypothetical protein KVR01_000846 [Diaporthe batatas]